MSHLSWPEIILYGLLLWLGVSIPVCIFVGRELKRIGEEAEQ